MARRYLESRLMPTPPPPKENRFKPGQSGNPGGKTREQRQAEIAAAELAAKLQYRMLEAMAGLFNEHPEKEKIVEHIKADPLRLIMDAMDRGFGKPGQNIDLSSTDGSMTPQVVERIIVQGNAKE
jgi:hypothetical protein